jgi:hypothetical protein
MIQFNTFGGKTAVFGTAFADVPEVMRLRAENGWDGRLRRAGQTKSIGAVYIPDATDAGYAIAPAAEIDASAPSADHYEERVVHEVVAGVARRRHVWAAHINRPLPASAWREIYGSMTTAFKNGFKARVAATPPPPADELENVGSAGWQALVFLKSNETKSFAAVMQALLDLNGGVALPGASVTAVTNAWIAKSKEIGV